MGETMEANELPELPKQEDWRSELVRERFRALGIRMGEAADALGLDEVSLVNALKEDRAAVYRDVYSE
jgi:hypothetical protein